MESGLENGSMDEKMSRKNLKISAQGSEKYKLAEHSAVLVILTSDLSKYFTLEPHRPVCTDQRMSDHALAVKCLAHGAYLHVGVS